MNNWDNIRFFIAIARSGTVSAAGKALSVSHATVLRRIDQLERELSLKLFYRLQSGYRLTEAGERLLEQALLVEQQALQFSHHDIKPDQAMTGRILVSQPESDVLDLYPIYQRFMQRYPDIYLEIHATIDQANLNRREADVAIRFTNTPHELLVGRRLGRIRYGAYASKVYLEQFDGPPSLDQLRWILWWHKNREATANVQSDWLQSRIAKPKVVMQTTSTGDVLNATRAGIGVGMISHMVARNYPDISLICDVELDDPPILWILTHRDLRNIARVKTFMRFVAEELRDWQKTVQPLEQKKRPRRRAPSG